MKCFDAQWEAFIDLEKSLSFFPWCYAFIFGKWLGSLFMLGIEI